MSEFAGISCSLLSRSTARAAILTILVAWLCAGLPVRGRGAGAGEGESVPPVDEETEEGTAFKAAADLRDPFSPIDYVSPTRIKQQHETVKTGVFAEQQQRALAKLRYGGTIKSGNKFFATVNGTMVQEGDVVAVTVEGSEFRFKVFAITMKGVKFKPAD